MSMSQTTSKQIAAGVVGIVIGFILGFFVAQGTLKDDAGLASTEGDLPENHPSPELLQRIESWLTQAKADLKDRQVRVSLGNAYYDMGRFDAAVQWYEEALNLDDGDVRVTTDLGTSYLYLGRVDDAVQTYEKSLALDPYHPQTLQNLGIAHFSTGRYAQAVEVWEVLVEKHPDYPNADEIREQIETARMHQLQATGTQ
jgi:tetratricopeptide (TPR) repeat protein